MPVEGMLLLGRDGPPWPLPGVEAGLPAGQPAQLSSAPVWPGDKASPRLHVHLRDWSSLRGGRPSLVLCWSSHVLPRSQGWPGHLKTLCNFV